jgi:hypothetical protein
MRTRAMNPPVAKTAVLVLRPPCWYSNRTPFGISYVTMYVKQICTRLLVFQRAGGFAINRRAGASHQRGCTSN